MIRGCRSSPPRPPQPLWKGVVRRTRALQRRRASRELTRSRPGGGAYPGRGEKMGAHNLDQGVRTIPWQGGGGTYSLQPGIINIYVFIYIYIYILVYTFVYNKYITIYKYNYMNMHMCTYVHYFFLYTDI